jgi:HSP20 family molecular chaperone IbpA
MAIAGFSKDNIKVETENNYLIVSGDISKDEAGNEISEYGDDEIIEIKNNLKVESFKRGFEFPIDTPFDYSNPKVSLIDGILKIRIERKPELIKEKKEIVIE